MENSLQNCETPSKASPLVFSYFAAFTAASAKTQHKTLLSTTGETKRSYFTLQYRQYPKTSIQLHSDEVACPHKQCWSGVASMGTRASDDPTSPPTPQARDAQTGGTGLNPFPAPTLACQPREGKRRATKQAQTLHLGDFISASVSSTEH